MPTGIVSDFEDKTQDGSIRYFPWWSLLELLSWYPIFNSSHCNSYEDQPPTDEIKWVAVTWPWWWGTWRVVPVLPTRETCPIHADNIILHAYPHNIQIQIQMFIGMWNMSYQYTQIISTGCIYGGHRLSWWGTSHWNSRKDSTGGFNWIHVPTMQ